MKKTFKFFMMAAIVAAGFTACSDDNSDPIGPNNPGNPSIERGEETMASFSLNLNGTSATRGLDADGTSENENIQEFRVLLFDAVTGDLELDTLRTGISSNDTIVTAKVTSGQKYIYVYANGGQTNQMSIPVKGAITAKQSAWPHNQAWSLTSGSSPWSDLANIHSLYPAGNPSYFFYSSTTVEGEHMITLEPGITAPESAQTSSKNYIKVQLDRPVAKVSVTKTYPSGPSGVTFTWPNGISGTAPSGIVTKDTTGQIVATSVKYLIQNANAKMYPFQKWESGVLTTPEYLPNQDVDPVSLQHYVRGLGAGNGNTPIAIGNRSGVPTGNYYYVPENNPSSKMKGNTTIAAVEVEFLPIAGTYATGVAYNDAKQEFTLTYGAVNMGTVSDMYLMNTTGILGVAKGTLFAGSSSTALYNAKKVYYHIKNPTVAEKANLSDYNSLVTDADLLLKEVYFMKYTNGKAYYTLPFGEQAGAGTIKTITRTVKRNFYYDANITAFAKLGENTINKTYEPEKDIVQGDTYLSVNIEIRDWTGKEINAEL
ncbi:Mfa1 family fimbria major subunit [Parabacteroides sp. PF5-9]|uniref:Mfa1 family fimbria major subunit n=1 Tax=Parabacteroides sp. PF5-9 TaxID=1742404 RepID=UPI002473108E|nr:Mfa1 family fimbria major subunit [Parabacteroides sp. PF5-9]MDH6358689.1 hypothetical protein [Parabacteroides sp. PF5-9]